MSLSGVDFSVRISAHILGGWAFLVLGFVLQGVSGVTKWMALPGKSVKWHGLSGQAAYAAFFTALFFAVWNTSMRGDGPGGKDPDGLMSVPLRVVWGLLLALVFGCLVKVRDLSVKFWGAGGAVRTAISSGSSSASDGGGSVRLEETA